MSEDVLRAIQERYTVSHEVAAAIATVARTVGRGGFRDEGGVWYGCITVGDANAAARVVAALQRQGWNHG